MNLSENIRYCTMLPSIEAYNLGKHPVPSYSITPPAIPVYSVAKFATDVVNGRVRAPFSPPPKPKTPLSKRYRTSGSNSSMKDIHAELSAQFEELFGPLDDDE